MFLTKIKFSTVYSDELTRNYIDGKVREVTLIGLNEEAEGYVIGRAFRFDGEIEPARNTVSLDSIQAEYEPPMFYPTKRYDFWKVAVAMNEVYLIPNEKSEKQLKKAGRVVKESDVIDAITTIQDKLLLKNWEDELRLKDCELTFGEVEKIV